MRVSGIRLILWWYSSPGGGSKLSQGISQFSQTPKHRHQPGHRTYPPPGSQPPPRGRNNKRQTPTPADAGDAPPRYGPSSSGWSDNPASAGMHYVKPQIPTDSFQLPPRNEPDSRKARKPPVRNLPPKPKVSKPPKKTTPRVRPAKRRPEPAQAEAKRQQRLVYEQQRNQSPERMEYRRLLAQEKRRKARELGQCRSCSNPAIPGQTRCPTCTEKHRESRRRSDAKRKTAAKGELAKASRGSTDRVRRPDGNGV